MKIFISWSGKYSQECAEVLHDWIKCTLQASQPWISSKDIDKGSLWFNEISDQLKDTKVGIVCLTKGNKEKPWILFESGALAKGLSANKVCTFLINLKPSDLEGPLSQFNHTTPDADGMKSLLITINKELCDNALEDKILDQVFETNWPSFEEKFKKLVESEPLKNTNKPTRSSDNILEEILYTTRTMDKRIRSLEREGTLIRDISEEEVIHSRRISKEEVIHRVNIMLDSGMSPDKIAKELRGIVTRRNIKIAISECLMNRPEYINDLEDKE